MDEYLQETIVNNQVTVEGIFRELNDCRAPEFYSRGINKRVPSHVLNVAVSLFELRIFILRTFESLFLKAQFITGQQQYFI